MSTHGSGASRAGGGGSHNEDAFLVEEGLGLYIVCDGASGSPAGEVAARVAAAALEEFVELSEFDLSGARASRVVVGQAMAHAIDAVAQAQRSDPELQGLDTTITMLLTHGRFGVFGHRGDSRAYLLRNERGHQLTLDHELTDSVVDDAASTPGFDVFTLKLRPGDTLVLCTDGAETVVQDDAIVRVAGDLSPRLLVSRIVSEAHRRTPELDATAVAVRVQADFEPGWLELSQPIRSMSFGHALVAA